MLEAILTITWKHRRWAAALALAAFAATLPFLPRLSVNDSPERWLPASITDAWGRFSRHFEHGDTIALALEFHEEVTDEDIDTLRSLRDGLEAIPGVQRVIDLSLLAAEVERVPLTAMLAEPEPGKPDRFSLYRGVLFDDPRVWDPRGEARAGGKRPSRTLIDVIDLDASVPESLDPRERQAVLDARRRAAVERIRDVLAKHRRDDLTFHLVGGVVIQYELEQIARGMARTLLPLSVVLTLVAMGVGFRSLKAVAVAFVGGLWSVAVLFGAVAALGWSLDVVTMGGPILMAVIVVATTVQFAHYDATHLGGTAAPGSPPGAGLDPAGDRQAAVHAIRWVAVPCFGAAVCAGIGFLMLAFNELGPARELGIQIFVGSSLGFLGAYIAWILVRPTRSAPGRWLSPSRLLGYQRAVLRWPRTTGAILVALMTFLCWAAWGLQVDADPFSFFRPGTPVAEALRHLGDRKFGHYILDVVLVPRVRPDGSEERAAARLADIEVAKGFEDRVRRRPEVRTVVSALAVQARMQSLQTLAADVRRAMAFRDMFRNWTVDLAGRDAIRITFTVSDPGEGFGPFMDDVRAALPDDRFECVLSGTVATVAALTDGLVGGISRGLGVSLVVMALLCAGLFRSIRLTLIAFLPNAFPVLFVFGLMGSAGIPLNSGSAMVATIALGMALIDTVHFVMHYRRRRLEGHGTDDAIAETFAEIGRPLVLTSAVNCVGFGIFLLSDFQPMYHFGLLASVSMVAALVGDVLLLPILLKVFDRSDATPSVATR